MEWEKTDLEEGRGAEHEYERSEPRTKSQQSEAERKSASANTEEDDGEYEFNKADGYKSDLDDKDYPEANPNVALLRPELHHHTILETGNSSSSIWRWGSKATSNDATKFFQRVM